MRKSRLLLVGVLLLAVCFSGFAATKVAYLTVVLDHPYWRAQRRRRGGHCQEAGRRAHRPERRERPDQAGEPGGQRHPAEARRSHLHRGRHRRRGCPRGQDQGRRHPPHRQQQADPGQRRTTCRSSSTPSPWASSRREAFVDFAKARYGSPKGNVPGAAGPAVRRQRHPVGEGVQVRDGQVPQHEVERPEHQLGHRARHPAGRRRLHGQPRTTTGSGRRATPSSPPSPPSSGTSPRAERRATCSG